MNTKAAITIGSTLRVHIPKSLSDLWQHAPRAFRDRLYHPSRPVEPHLSFDLALSALASAAQAAPPGLVPVTYVDDRSLACVVCRPIDGHPASLEGSVVRWHLDDIPTAHQGALLDVDAWLYAQSIVEESRAATRGYEGMQRAATEYAETYLAKKERPKPEALRPFQLACQNVIIGLAAMQHEPMFNALMVKHWLTCEVPHVATNEGARALCVLMLCDAFQAGGTMEINFERHPERRVPAALRRYGRTISVSLGEDYNDGKSISPAEARDLFLAVTPMPLGLRRRAERLVKSGVISAERLCYSLLSPVWRAIELDFILACSSRVASILTGGTTVDDRPGRLAELEVARAALMAGMLFRRLDGKDTIGAETEARVFDDVSNGVAWEVLEELGAIVFKSLPEGPLPWGADNIRGDLSDGKEVVVLPRAHPILEDVQTAQLVRERLAIDAPVLGLAPSDMAVPAGLSWLRCPDRISDLDAQVLRNLTAAKLARA